MLNFRSTLEFPEFDQALLEASQRSQRLRPAAGELNLGNGGARQTVRLAQLLHAMQNFIPARPDLRFVETRVFAAAPGEECKHKMQDGGEKNTTSEPARTDNDRPHPMAVNAPTQQGCTD